MTRLARQDSRSVAAVIAGPVVGAVVVGLLAWLAWLVVKGLVVVLTYVVGVALIVVPLLLGSRVLEGSHGRERLRRLAVLAVTVVAGFALCGVAHEIHRHGWLLVALPVAAVLVSRLAGRFIRRGGRGRSGRGRIIDIELR